MVQQIITELLTKLNEKEEFSFVITNDKKEQKIQSFSMGKFILDAEIDDNHYQIDSCFLPIWIEVFAINNIICEINIIDEDKNYLGGFINKTQDLSLEEMVNNISEILFSKLGLKNHDFDLMPTNKTTEEKDYYYSAEKIYRYLNYLCSRIETIKTIDDFCDALKTGVHNNVSSEPDYRYCGSLKWLIQERNLWVNITRWVRPQLNFIANKISNKINTLKIIKEVRRNGNEYFRCDEVDNNFTFHDVCELNEVFIQNYLVEETYEIRAAEQM